MMSETSTETVRWYNIFVSTDSEPRDQEACMQRDSTITMLKSGQTSIGLPYPRTEQSYGYVDYI